MDVTNDNSDASSNQTQQKGYRIDKKRIRVPGMKKLGP